MCPSTDKQIKKMSHTHTHTHTHKMKYCSVIKMKELPLFMTRWMGHEDIMINKVSQTERDKYCMISLIRGL